ncbi:MAG: hypothetical protein ACTSQY_00270 [Candidatus Odinarchaeia archaeon]|nr:MAG: hypothetical protein [Lokiarchaeota virus Fenrir Meg22_1012]URC17233.1 MAG: hypothetical protein [Lokiarchaeota virus Fenrir Meg22_1214]
MYVETGVSIRMPFRRVFSDEIEAIKDINKYKNYSNVYHSIYWFRNLETKINHLTGIKYEGIDYGSAIINKVVLDLDSYKTSILGDKKYEYYDEKPLEDIRKLEEWAEKLDLMREYRFSGGGFYFIFSAKGDPLKLRDFELSLSNELDVEIDPSTIGDTSRMMRVTNSFNFKEHRKCFCIPLKQEELFLEYEKIKKLASTPRFNKRFVYGNETFNFNSYKIDESKIKMKNFMINIKLDEMTDANDVLIKYGWEIEDFCDGIKKILSMDHKGNSLRVELIKYLKTIVGVKYEDCVKIMISLLKGEGIHSAIEGQAKYVYAGDWKFNPRKIKYLGYCDLDCDKCLKLRNVIYEVIKNGSKVSG